MRTVALLVNPTAGRGRAGRVAPQVAERLAGHDRDVRTIVGRDATEAEDLAHRAVAAGVDRVIALGGDGMVSVALQAVASSSTPLGIVPAGTGNDLARELGLPLGDPARAADVAAAGTTRRIDLGRCRTGTTERWFANVLSTGFDSRVNERANAMRRPRGRSRYHLALLAELGRLAPVPYEITADGTVLDRSAMLVAVGNGPSYGGGMHIAPAASVTDGLLDVTIIGPIGRARLVRLFPKIYPGTFVAYDDVVRTLRCRTVELAAPGTIAYADGERVGPLPVIVEAVPGALDVVVPQEAEPAAP